jgi:Tfp pilus assembly protein PilX
MNKNFNKKINNEKGIAILFAILMTSVLLLVALGITQISYKELLFSIETRDSNKAFMAADTGVECAMYMDSTRAFTGTSSDPFYCHGQLVVSSTPDNINFQFSLPITANSCAQVYINKAAGTGTSTQIDSYGYNVTQKDTSTCVDTTNLTPNLVSRALRITYPN